MKFLLFLCCSLLPFYCFGKTIRIYSAGPEVFLPQDKMEQSEKEKIEIISKINKLLKKQKSNTQLEILFPSDNQIKDIKNNTESGIKIFDHNIEFMDSADVIIANIVKLRGVHADPGTSFEIGYMLGIKKPIFIFYNESYFYNNPGQSGTMLDRILNEDSKAQSNKGGEYRDSNQLLVEDFKMADNLMLIAPYINQMRALGLKEATPQTFEEAVLRLVEYTDLKNSSACARSIPSK